MLNVCSNSQALGILLHHRPDDCLGQLLDVQLVGDERHFDQRRILDRLGGLLFDTDGRAVVASIRRRQLQHLPDRFFIDVRAVGSAGVHGRDIRVSDFDDWDAPRTAHNHISWSPADRVVGGDRLRERDRNRNESAAISAISIDIRVPVDVHVRVIVDIHVAIAVYVDVVRAGANRNRSAAGARRAGDEAAGLRRLRIPPEVLRRDDIDVRSAWRS